jgi:exosome complex component RRP4
MAITILAPAPPALPYKAADSDDDSDDGGADLQGDINMRPSKRARHSHEEIVTPGHVVTDEPQWMRQVIQSVFCLVLANPLAEVMVHIIM